MMSFSRRSRYSRSPSYKRSVSRSLSRSRSRSRSPSCDVENPGNNLYVTGLSSRIARRDIEKHFATEGTVTDIHLVADPWTRESRGFGFVTMSTNEEAERCIKYLDRSVIEGRVISVEKARRRRGRTPTPGRYLGLRAVHVRRRSPSYSPRRSPSYSPYRRSLSRSSCYSSDRSRSRSRSPHYHRRSHCSPYRGRSRYYRYRSYSPYSRRRYDSPCYRQRERSSSRSRSPYESCYHYSPDDHYYRRQRYHRSYYSRRYSCSPSPELRRSSSRSLSDERWSYSPEPRSRRNYLRSNSPEPRRRSRSYSPSVSPEPRRSRRSPSSEEYSGESGSRSPSEVSRSVSPA